MSRLDDLAVDCGTMVVMFRRNRRKRAGYLFIFGISVLVLILCYYLHPSLKVGDTNPAEFDWKTLTLLQSQTPVNIDNVTTTRDSTSAVRTARSSAVFAQTTTASNAGGGGYLSQMAPVAGTGLGNLMFMYASLLGIADHANMTPVYPSAGQLRQVFTITASSLTPLNATKVRESKAGTFDPELFSLAGRHGNVTVVGYVQSWRYFSAIADRVRRDLRFNENLRSEADDFLKNISQSIGNTAHEQQTVYIGVHIRRRDLLYDFNIRIGYTIATRDYLVGAVNYFRLKFPVQTLVYVVCSDDQVWSRQNFPSPSGNSSFVTFSENRTGAEDMAILAACNHSILTVGTFGWWSAYLAGGTTVYYQAFPAPKTQLAYIYKKEDYFPPNWIGM